MPPPSRPLTEDVLLQTIGFPKIPPRVGLSCGIAVAFLLILGLQQASGQERAGAPAQFAESQWRAAEGELPSNDVREIVQTDDGYLWLGTMGGLARFDGAAFTETRLTRLEARGRANDRILDLQAHDDGLLVLYQSHDLVHYRREGPRQVADSVWAYQVDSDGQVWLGSGRDVSVYHADGTVDRVTTAGAPVRALHRTGDGTLWIG
ncbi:MAG: two-component regulator propeller domain-containing protein [Salinibacter sp.]